MNNKIRVGEFGQVLMRFASAQVVSNFLRILSGLIVVRLLEPSLYGEFTGVGVYMGYVLLGHGGVLNGLSRELPFEYGKKNESYAKKLAFSSFFLAAFLSLITAIAFLVIGVYKIYSGNELIGLIYLSYSFIGGFQLLNKQFLPRLYFRNEDFNLLSKQNIKFGLGTFITVVLVYLFNIYGLLIRGVVLAVYQFFLLFSKKPFKLELKFKIRHLKTLFKTGFPIFLVGQVNPLWITILNTIIFNLGGPLSFGLYALSNIIFGAIGIIPSAFASVIYPRMSIMLGGGKSVNYILKANIKPLIFQVGFTLVIAIVGLILLPPSVQLILPKYVNGIKAAQWMLFVPVAQSFGALNNIYNVVKKQQWYFVSLLTGAIVGSLFVYIKVQSGNFQLEYFPQGILLGTIIQQVLSFLFLSTLKRNG